jgi:hypothetical protein
MARGNPDNLRGAAQRKHAHAVQRAEQAINALVREGEPINFRAVARLADCSPDFLYRTPALRTRIEGLRAAPTPRRAIPEQPEHTNSNVIRELAAQLADEKRHRRTETSTLEAALATAQGELLQLRRRLGSTNRSAHTTD